MHPRCKTCLYCKVVETVCFWEPPPQKGWKRPALFVTSAALSAAAVLAIKLTLARGDLQFLSALSLLFMGFTLLGSRFRFAAATPVSRVTSGGRREHAAGARAHAIVVWNGARHREPQCRFRAARRDQTPVPLRGHLGLPDLGRLLEAHVDAPPLTGFSFLCEKRIVTRPRIGRSGGASCRTPLISVSHAPAAWPRSSKRPAIDFSGRATAS